jgi:uncharacterized protein
MKTNLYAVYDSKAKIYGQIFQMLNDDIAKRTLSPAVNNEEHNYGMFPEDFTLHCIGLYTDDNGIIAPENRKICELIELRQMELPLEQKS